MIRTVALSLVAAIVLLGCEKKEVKKENEPPPPPTAEQVYNELYNHIAPLIREFMVEEAEIPAEMVDSAINQLRASKTKHQLGPNGPEGINRVVTQVADALNRAYDAKAWSLCLAMGQAMEVLEPNNKAYQGKLDRALVEKNKPKVMKFSTFTTNGITTIMLTLYLPKTGETKDFKVREGEEFEDLKLIEIIGNNDGLKFEYIPTGDTIEWFKPGKQPPAAAPTPAPAQ